MPPRWRIAHSSQFSASQSDGVVTQAPSTVLGRPCQDIVAADPNEILSFDYAKTAGLYAQVNGVLAAIVFAAIVLKLQQPRETKTPRSLLVLPVLFFAAVATSYEYAVVAGDLICERLTTLSLLTGIAFVFVVVGAMASLFLLAGEAGYDPARLGSGILLATVAASGAALAAGYSDLRVEFGLRAESLPHFAGIVGLQVGVALLCLSAKRWRVSHLTNDPLRRERSGDAWALWSLTAAVIFFAGQVVTFVAVGESTKWHPHAWVMNAMATSAPWITFGAVGLMSGLLVLTLPVRGSASLTGSNPPPLVGTATSAQAVDDNELETMLEALSAGGSIASASGAIGIDVAEGRRRVELLKAKHGVSTVRDLKAIKRLQSTTGP